MHGEGSTPPGSPGSPGQSPNLRRSLCIKEQDLAISVGYGVVKDVLEGLANGNDPHAVNDNVATYHLDWAQTLSLDEDAQYAAIIDFMRNVTQCVTSGKEGEESIQNLEAYKDLLNWEAKVLVNWESKQEEVMSLHVASYLLSVVLTRFPNVCREVVRQLDHDTAVLMQNDDKELKGLEAESAILNHQTNTTSQCRRGDIEKIGKRIKSKERLMMIEAKKVDYLYSLLQGSGKDPKERTVKGQLGLSVCHLVGASSWDEMSDVDDAA